MSDIIALPQLGIDNELMELRSLEGIREYSAMMMSQARRYIRIYTPDLEHEIYDNADIRDVLSRFARDNRHSEVQILLDDVRPIVKRGHMLLELSRRLPSSIQLRQARNSTEDPYSSYVIADRSGYIALPEEQEEQHRQANFCDQVRSEMLINAFDREWQKSYTPVEIRTLSL